jgi:NADH:ubiquinone oxidoreductase subunit E
MQKLMNLLLALGDIAQDGVLTAEAIEELGEDQGGVPRAQLYAAAVLNPELRFEKTHDVTFVCCVGGCQEWGALDRVEQLLRLRERTRDEGRPGFDVHARLCLDKCEDAPVVMAVTPDGIAAIPQADEATIAEAVARLVG